MTKYLLRSCTTVLVALFASGYAQATTIGDVITDATVLNKITEQGLASTTDVTDVTTLDISNCALTTATWLSNFTNLTKLVAAQNDLQYVDLSNNTLLTYLDLSGNDDLVGFRSYAASSTYHNIVLANGVPLTYLDLSDCNIGYFQTLANSTGYGVTTLTHLNLANNTALDGWSSGITAQTGLVYCNLSNTGQTTSSVAFTANFTALDTLILSNNSNFGYSTTFKYLSGLTYLDISGCDIYFRSNYLLSYLTPTNNPNLETLICSNSGLASYTEGLDNFTKLKYVDVSNNPKMTQFWVNGSPLLEQLIINGNAAMTYLKLNEDDLPRNTFTITGGADCTALTSLYLNGNKYSDIKEATDDYTSDWALSSIKFLYLENNQLNGTLAADDIPSSLTGLDIGNNNFTSLNIESLPSTLTALMVGPNENITSLEMHYNPGITQTTSSTTMSDGSGLYLLGCTNLNYLDISGTADQANCFTRIGNNNSLQNVPIKTIKAAYNKFTTFRNLTATASSSEKCYRWYWKNKGESAQSSSYDSMVWPASAAQADSASLEDLTQLEYLDVSHNQLSDSVYLYCNTELKYLDVSHNRKIVDCGSHASKKATITGTTSAYKDYKKYLWMSGSSDCVEPYTGDYNDTTGLYILDLSKNHKLEYLDISYTGIEHTALTHIFVNNARYVWIQNCDSLKYFYADYNGMRSLGVSTPNGHNHNGLTKLERLSAIGMRGADQGIMQGSINLHGDVNTRLHYVNLSYSDYDSIGCGYTNGSHYGTTYWDDIAESLDTLIIRGNPIHALDVHLNKAMVYVDARDCLYSYRGYNPLNINEEEETIYFTNVLNTTNYPNGAKSKLGNLRRIHAHTLPVFTTLLVHGNYDANYSLSGDEYSPIKGLYDVYCNHDSVLIGTASQMPGIVGLDECIALDLLYVNNDQELNALDLSNNVNLEYLHAYNDPKLGPALGETGLDLTANGALITAWVSSDNLLQLNVTNSAVLDTLKCYNNYDLTQGGTLNLANNNALRYLDLHQCAVRDLGNEGNVSGMTQLVYFDCTSTEGIPEKIGETGKNTLSDLVFNSNNIETVKAGYNDLYCIKGLGKSTLTTLTYPYNHINGIDLSGSNISTYDATHNGRGVVEAELSQWQGESELCNMYYFQLEKNAGDALDGSDNYFGYKTVPDTLTTALATPSIRELEADGYEEGKSIEWVKNSAGPYTHQANTSSASRRIAYVRPGDAIDESKINGSIAVLDPDIHWASYKYLDGRTDESTSEYYIVWVAPDKPTNVEETVEEALGTTTVVSERYFDASGMEHSEPVEGVNIIVRQMSDGTTHTVKILR